MSDPTPRRAVFVGDVFRTHTMLKGGRFGGSTVKLAALLRNTLECLGYRCTVVEDRDSPAAKALYERIFGHYDNVHTWALRSQVLTPRVAEFYARLLDGARLVIGFEVPESLYDFCRAEGIAVYDFSFHFVRFEADYTLMVRTTEPRAADLLRRIRHRVRQLDIQRQLGLGGAADRLGDGLGDGEEIGLFLMQTRFDRSKFDGKGGILDDLELIRQADLPITHYKLHPMEHRPEIELHFARAGARPFPPEAGIYRFLAGHGHRTRLHTVSSGLAAEGDLIGVAGVEFLAGFPWRVEGYERFTAAAAPDRGRYIPVEGQVFAPDFLRALIGGENWKPDPAEPASSFSLKEFWNVKWS